MVEEDDNDDNNKVSTTTTTTKKKSSSSYLSLSHFFLVFFCQWVCYSCFFSPFFLWFFFKIEYYRTYMIMMILSIDRSIDWFVWLNQSKYYIIVIICQWRNNFLARYVIKKKNDDEDEDEEEEDEEKKPETMRIFHMFHSSHWQNLWNFYLFLHTTDHKCHCLSVITWIIFLWNHWRFCFFQKKKILKFKANSKQIFLLLLL